MHMYTHTHIYIHICSSGFVSHRISYKGVFPLVAYKYSAPNQESISGLFEPLDH